MSQEELRIIERKEGSSWTQIRLIEAKPGDVLRVFEPDGDRIGDLWEVCANPVEFYGKTGASVDPVEFYGKTGASVDPVASVNVNPINSGALG